MVQMPAKVSLALCRTLATAFPSAMARRLQHPYFFVGCGRSGTTLLSGILSTHPDLSVFPTEANDLWHPHLYPLHRAKVQSKPFWADGKAFTDLSLSNRSETDDRRMQAIFGAYQFMTAGRRFVNKSVMVTFMIPHILNLFPDARFIHLVRDGRAVALSYAHKELPKIQNHSDRYGAVGYDLGFDEILDTFARHWQDHIDEIERQKVSLDLEGTNRLFEFRYETFCKYPQQEVAKLAAFLEVDVQQFQMPVVRSTNYKFQQDLPAEQLLAIETTMEPALRQKGYLA